MVILVWPALAADRTGVYAILERVVFEPAEGAPARVQLWGAFLIADRPDGDGYRPAARGYLYYACPPGREATCKADWSDFQWTAGTMKGIGFAQRAKPIGRLRAPRDEPVRPDSYPYEGGLLKMESKDPSQADLVAQLKAALK